MGVAALDSRILDDVELPHDVGGRHHPVSHRKVAQLPRAQQCSLQCNRKTEERANHLDRGAQFRVIGAAVRKYVREGLPVIVIDMRNYETIVHLIARTITVNGLRVTCRLDRRKYSTGRKVSAAHLTRVEFQLNAFHGEWKRLHPSQPWHLRPLCIYESYVSVSMRRCGRSTCGAISSWSSP